MMFGVACQVSYAQNQSKIELQYDNAGNRIIRRKATPLPVTLISFKAEKQTDNQQQPSALLKWRTASEINSDHFEIQRSEDGKKWSQIGIVQANGDKASDTDYFFVDETPMDGENVYRLKMVDRDATFAYSSLQSLRFESLVVFYPNPVKSWLQIKGLAGTKAKISSVQIWNAAGKLMRRSTTLPIQGVDMTSLPTGIYTVQIIHINGLVTTRNVVKE